MTCKYEWRMLGISSYGRWCFSICKANNEKPFDSRTRVKQFTRSPRHYKKLQIIEVFYNVGVPGIEPGPRVPKTRILPIYYTPI